jgi:hypothetical protein
MLINEFKIMYFDTGVNKMKTFIRTITIIIVLTFILTTLAIAQNAAGTASVGLVSNDDELLAPSSTNALVQLRTLLSTTNQQHDGGKVLVIPTSEIKPQEMANLMEDMTVMCRIFDKKLAQSNLIPRRPFLGRMTFSNPFSMDNQSMGAMYVQGYGVLFMTTVDFPLSPPPKTEEKEEIDEEDADPVWEQMKQEIFSPQETARRTAGRQEETYDATKVENLKSTLVKALVHAANIRHLKPDESVILTVTGSGTSSNSVKVTAIPGHNQVMVTYKDKNKNVTKLLTSPSLNDLGISSPMVLTIRAKKSYIDALAQNKIDFDEFEQKMQLLTYPCLGENLSRGSSPYFWQSGSSGIDTTEPSSTDRQAY